jgi:nicotinamide phosphoribosyltransferase
MTVIQIHELFRDNFFSKNKEEVCGEIKREYSTYLGCDYDVSHIEKLHDLGYLPIKIKSIEEGRLVPIGVPVLTISNTLPEFYWVTNFLETIISNLLWKPITSATIANEYKKKMLFWAKKTDEKNIGFVEFQCHDFSMRGMDSLSASMSSGLGHASSFLGSDSLPVIHGARKYYGESEGVVYSVNATEHSVMCAGGDENELDTFRYLMQQFPSGILSIVSDTWNLWDVLTKHLPKLKDEILSRDGKIVVRPDSGDPVDIICGSENGTIEEKKGVIELLWDVFGGSVNEQGYKVLDPHIGAIYGDSITLERAEQICRRLSEKGFASTNIVFGVGSFTYQFNTRDTFGFAMKATYVEVNGIGREIFKDPVTDSGEKKSAKGLLFVGEDEHGNLYVEDMVKIEQELSGELNIIYENGRFQKPKTLSKIRQTLSIQ